MKVIAVYLKIVTIQVIRTEQSFKDVSVGEMIWVVADE